MLRSPFPGMDPFLERHWSGVHMKLIAYASDQLQPRVGDDLRVRVEERVFVEDDDERGELRPDVFVIEHPVASRDLSDLGGGIAVVADVPRTQPKIVRVQCEPLRQRYLQIIDVRNGRRVVTVIEFVSPSNKRGRSGHEAYREKQAECLAARVNFVEIDLTRAPGRSFALEQRHMDRFAPGEYQACVCRASDPGAYETYGFSLREPLGDILIPLRETDADAVLDLQPLVDQVYVNGRFDDIDYTATLEPPLSSEDQAWLAERLGQRVEV